MQNRTGKSVRAKFANLRGLLASIGSVEAQPLSRPPLEILPMMQLRCPPRGLQPGASLTDFPIPCRSIAPVAMLDHRVSSFSKASAA